MAGEDQYHEEMRKRLEAVEKRSLENEKKCDAVLKGLAKKANKAKPKTPPKPKKD